MWLVQTIFLFEIAVKNPQYEVLKFCQHELLNLSFVKRKTLFYSSSLFHPQEHIDLSCPLLRFENVGKPSST